MKGDFNPAEQSKAKGPKFPTMKTSALTLEVSESWSKIGESTSLKKRKILKPASARESLTRRHLPKIVRLHSATESVCLGSINQSEPDRGHGHLASGGPQGNFI